MPLIKFYEYIECCCRYFYIFNEWYTIKCLYENIKKRNTKYCTSKYDSVAVTHLRLRLNKICLSRSINWQHVVRQAALCVPLQLYQYTLVKLRSLLLRPGYDIFLDFFHIANVARSLLFRIINALQSNREQNLPIFCHHLFSHIFYFPLV